MNENIKRGLVLEGGAMRGLFSVGVMDVMMENGLKPDGIVGVSAGAAFGCNYKSHQPGRALRYNQRFARDKRYCSLRSLLTTGNIFNAEFAYHTVPTQYDIFAGHTFASNDMEYYVVCTDVETGAPVYHQCTDGGEDFFEWVRASASMPLVSRVVELDGKRLLDGGVSDSVPLRFFEGKRYNRNVVVLTQPLGYRKSPSTLASALYKIFLRKYPRLVDALNERWQMYNAQLEYVAEAEARDECVVIRPAEALPIGHISHDADEMQVVYDLGRKAGEEKLAAMKQIWAQ